MVREALLKFQSHSTKLRWIRAAKDKSKKTTSLHFNKSAKPRQAESQGGRLGQADLLVSDPEGPRQKNKSTNGWLVLKSVNFELIMQFCLDYYDNI